MMKRKTGVLQKVSLFFGILSFLLAAACGVWLYLRVDGVGGYNPISASLMASIFFFCCVGGILTLIGRSNIPNFSLKDEP